MIFKMSFLKYIYISKSIGLYKITTIYLAKHILMIYLIIPLDFTSPSPNQLVNTSMLFYGLIKLIVHNGCLIQ
jgi:hypothetical protein